MGTFNQRLAGDGPITYENIGANPISGGKLGVPKSGATQDKTLQGFDLAGDGAKNIIGVTEHDTVPLTARAAAENSGMSYDSGYNMTDLSVPDATTTIYHDTVGYMQYTTAAAYGDRLAAAASGNVRKWLDADGEAAVVGSCVQPGGVSAAGRALARIRRP